MVEHSHLFVQKFLSILVQELTFSILQNQFSKTPILDYVLYILFYLNNYSSFFVYYYLERARERERGI